MCGIFGIVAAKGYQFKATTLNEAVDDLFVLSYSRGKEAAGIMVNYDGEIKVYKEPIDSKKFIEKKTYLDLLSAIDLSEFGAAIVGHSRLATNGLQTENINNQPVVAGGVVGVHNGIVVNDNKLWKKIVSIKPQYEVDTEAMLALVDDSYVGGMNLRDSISRAYKLIEGSASLAIFSAYESVMHLATNTGSLYYAEIDKNMLFVFASERYIMEQFLERNFSGLKNKIIHLLPGNGLEVDLKRVRVSNFELKGGKLTKKDKITRKTIISVMDVSDANAEAGSRVTGLYNQLNDIKKIKKHDFDYEAIYELRRCSKCILPETTPFITFDEDGVCNFCHEHAKIEYKGIEALREMVEPYRSKNGEPDCLVAFSGGRDSSYGLHFLKKELGLNPIAYTYDWGMVTDLARQNEARMLGALGIEHIIVSANITMKREHIRKHILAWMQKPDLGMVPLFMEGDKQCEYYMDDLSKKTGIKLIFFCRGNEFEKEEFKIGHCGIKDADPGGVIHNLALSGKMQIAWYYFKQYLTNPAYINSSIVDTLFAYFSTYIQKHDYVFLWHYVPWEEKRIINTLTKNYNWQASEETNATWRTDDGTSAFYNYIYYVGQGFTENDSFRARQVREGRLTRKRALELVHEENKPRYEALKWYFDRVGLDGDEVLSVVDNMRKLY